MKNYAKPIVLVNEELTEGVYAASGAIDGPFEQPGEPTPEPPVEEVGTDCWDVGANSVQDWNGSHHVFEVWCTHTMGAEHISSNTEVTLTFSSPLTDAYSEFPCSFSGNSVTVNRELHANAYHSGDRVTYKVWASTGDESTTKALACEGATISCTHTINVQGGFD